jgi:hypothetical protein
VPLLRSSSNASALSAGSRFRCAAGIAIASSHYLINSPHQIKPSVLLALRGAEGPQGPTGPQGQPAPRGAAGLMA